MATIKKDYGLVYAEDGSLCATIHEEDVPFAGVKSYAIEQGTTNLVTSYVGYESIVNGDKPLAYANSSQPTYRYYANSTYAKIFNTDITDTVVANDESIAISGWLKYKTGTLTNPLLYVVDSTGSNVFNTSLTAVPKDNQWHYFSIVWKNTSGASITVGTVNAQITSDTATQAEGYAFQIQVEKIPYVTSFVQGTRPDGIMRLPVNLPNGNYVVSFWAKLIRSNEVMYWMHLVNGEANGTNDGWALTFRGSTDATAPGALNVTMRNAGVNTFYYNTSINFNVIKNQWHMYTIRHVGSVIDVFFDDQKVLSNISVPWSYSIYKLWVGRSFANPFSSYEAKANGFRLANLFVGKAKDELGNWIWSDEYIQQVYLSHMPFTVPPKLPIM